METDIIYCDGASGSKKVKGPSSTKEIFHRYLAKLLLKYFKWEQLLKDSEKAFVVVSEKPDEDNDDGDKRLTKKPRLCDESNYGEDVNGVCNGKHENGGDGCISGNHETKTIATLDWRSSGGALTQDEKVLLYRDLKVLMNQIAGFDTSLMDFVKKYRIDNEVIT